MVAQVEQDSSHAAVKNAVVHTVVAPHWGKPTRLRSAARSGCIPRGSFPDDPAAARSSRGVVAARLRSRPQWEECPAPAQSERASPPAASAPGRVSRCGRGHRRGDPRGPPELLRTQRGPDLVLLAAADRRSTLCLDTTVISGGSLLIPMGGRVPTRSSASLDATRGRWRRSWTPPRQRASRKVARSRSLMRQLARSPHCLPARKPALARAAPSVASPAAALPRPQPSCLPCVMTPSPIRACSRCQRRVESFLAPGSGDGSYPFMRSPAPRRAWTAHYRPGPPRPALRPPGSSRHQQWGPASCAVGSCFQ